MLSPSLSALFLLLTCAPSAVSGRRILHEPFFPPQDSAVPPSDPPSLSPPEPKYPFSSSVSTPDPSPFFQTYPSSPPPPPPVAFASFPANISSLQLPDAPSAARSPSKLAVAVSAAVVSAVVAAGTALFCFCRRRRIREVSDEKAAGAPVSGEAAAASRAQKLSAEILYLGTIVNSRPTGDDVGGDNGDGDVSGHRKVESPELRPLPPLSRRSDRSFGSTAGDEEFYSPEVSLGGGGSAAVESFLSGSSSCSSSSSGSPGRSHSVSLSPPVSLSPRRSEPKSPGHVAAVARPPPPSEPLMRTAYVINEPYTSSASSSERGSSENRDGSPTKSDGYGKYLRSPTLSPAILSAPPDQAPSLRLWTASGRNGHSPTPSMTSSSPERNPETVTANQKHTPSPATRNPETVTAKQKHTPSPALSPATRSPDRNPDQPTRVTTAMIQNVPSPARNKPSSAAPPPPPPLPPQKPSSPPKNPSKPIIAQLSSQPPPLTPPSRPFMFQHPTKSPPTPIQTNQPMEKIEEETSKPKLKPLHWDKVRASSGRDMVWDHLGSNSFKLNEEMIESLFIVNTPQSKPKVATPRSTSPYQDNRVLDPKKSQNIAIALRALNVTVDKVCDALSEGNADALGAELLEILLKMAPNKEEERKLKDFKDDSSIKLGTAEKFLKAMLDVPFAFRRVDAMLYMANFETEIGYLNKSFETLEAACEELRSDRMFLKLLEAVLKTGNRMNVGTNRGDAHAFKLDTLLKLVDVKGADGKTTLLHFVVQEIIRTEGARLSDKNQAPGLPTLSKDVKCRKLGLQVVSGLSSELANVKKSASMDSEVLASDVYKLCRGINNIEEILRLNENIPPGETRQRFSESMNRFKKTSEEEILRIQARESAVLSLVKEITEYFHGNSASEEAHPFRIFMVVRDFLNILERVCKEVGSAHKLPVPINPMMPQPVLVFPEKKQHSSSDDDEPES